MRSLQQGRSWLGVALCGLLLGSYGSAPAAAQSARRVTTLPTDAGSRPGSLDAPVTRFVALGDTGEGNPAQYQVAAAMGVVRQRLGTDFALLLGDNFYDDGVDSPLDAQFQTKFEQPYGPLGFPFHPILGNHDYGSQGNEFFKGDYQVAYGALNPQWVLPALHNRFGTDTAFFVGLDTQRILHGLDAQQRADVAAWTSEAAGRWKIAFGHHAYVSNGQHGSAGSYEGTTGLPIVSGDDVKSFFDDLIVGQFDLYLCGNDHNLQDLVEVGGTSFLVSGAGSKTTPLVGTHPTYFEVATEGFYHLEARSHTLTVRAYDSRGNLLHSRVLRK